MPPSEHATKTFANGAAEVAKSAAEWTPTTPQLVLAAIMLGSHAFVVWRWWLFYRLRAIPPCQAVVWAIEKNRPGQSLKRILVYHVTPITGPDADRRFTWRATVRLIFSPFKAVEGQRIPVHIHPTIRGRHLVPHAGNPWFHALAIYLLFDLMILITLPFIKW